MGLVGWRLSGAGSRSSGFVGFPSCRFKIFGICRRPNPAGRLPHHVRFKIFGICRPCRLGSGSSGSADGPFHRSPLIMSRFRIFWDLPAGSQFRIFRDLLTAPHHSHLSTNPVQDLRDLPGLKKLGALNLSRSIQDLWDLSTAFSSRSSGSAARPSPGRPFWRTVSGSSGSAGDPVFCSVQDLLGSAERRGPWAVGSGSSGSAGKATAEERGRPPHHVPVQDLRGICRAWDGRFRICGICRL